MADHLTCLTGFFLFDCNNVRTFEVFKRTARNSFNFETSKMQLAKNIKNMDL